MVHRPFRKTLRGDRRPGPASLPGQGQPVDLPWHARGAAPGAVRGDPENNSGGRPVPKFHPGGGRHPGRFLHGRDHAAGHANRSCNGRSLDPGDHGAARGKARHAQRIAPQCPAHRRCAPVAGAGGTEVQQTARRHEQRVLFRRREPGRIAGAAARAKSRLVAGHQAARAVATQRQHHRLHQRRRR